MSKQQPWPEDGSDSDPRWGGPEGHALLEQMVGHPLPSDNNLPLRFDGPEYKPAEDNKRLTGQLLRIWNVMKDSKWRTLPEISAATGDPQASISAQLRHLRKPRFGSHTVNRRARGDRKRGLFEYQLEIRKGG